LPNFTIVNPGCYITIDLATSNDNNDKVATTTAVINANAIPKKIKVIIYGVKNTTATNNNAIPPKYW
jgi:hypothetical protein